MTSELKEIHTDDALLAPFRDQPPRFMQDAILAFFRRASRREDQGVSPPLTGEAVTRSVFLPQDRMVITRGAFLTHDREALEEDNDKEMNGILVELLRECTEKAITQEDVVLSTEEKKMLLWEVDKKFRQSGTLMRLFLCCSLGAATQGMNEVSESGPSY